jgi:hypothetical protein
LNGIVLACKACLGHGGPQGGAQGTEAFLETIPGVLAQIAGVITALGAMAGVVTSTGIIGGGDATPAAKSSVVGAAKKTEERSQAQVDWARKANVICTKTIQAYRKLPRKPVTIALLQHQNDIGWNKVGKIRDLAMPAGETATYRKYVSAIAVQMESLDERLQLIKSTKVADEKFKRDYDALIERIHAQNRRSDTLAVELGATVCAKEPY